MKVGQNADKKGVLDELLQLGMVLVAIDARAVGVDVPSHLGVDPQLRLNLSWRFGRPMDIDDWGIFAELTFGGAPYPCKFPWDAIFLIVSHVNGESYLFPDHVPQELLQQATEGHDEDTAQKSAPAKKRGRPALSLVQADDDGDDGAEASQAQEAPSLAATARPPKQRPHRADTRADDAAPQLHSDVRPEPALAHPAKDSDHGDAHDGDAPPPTKPAKSRGHLRLVK